MANHKSYLGRYERDAQGRYIIDVAAERPEALYNYFDKHADYLRRDLDQELTDYLTSSAKELPGTPLVIRFTFSEEEAEEKYTRIRSSIGTFFQYMAELERETTAEMLRKAGLLFAVGVAIMFLAVWVRQWIGESPSVVGEVFAEGLTVAAWVSLWEGVALVLLEWRPHRRRVRRYERLEAAEVQFRSKA
ncbi:hypothetical protein WCX18_02640 [Sulfurimonas sp. HSL1-2]|uniref:hypothetical protein n=1 Tax=Thiomicrolovo zhangzhouensis TaxID=3131933 RepID=UPI0031F738CB